MKKNILIWSVLAVLLAGTAPAAAREGLYLEAFYPKASWSGDIRGLDSGVGLGARAGAGLSRYIGIEGSLFKTTHDAGVYPTVDFKGGTLDLVLFFPLSASQMEPYIHGGIGRYYLEDVTISAAPFATGEYRGDGNQFGAGINLFLFPELSLNAGYTRTRITFDEGTGLSSLKGIVRVLHVGLAYHFL